MNFNPIDAITALVKGTGGAITGVTKVFKGSKAERDQQGHDRFMSTQQSFSAEFRNVKNRNWFDSLVDGFNRLMRPGSLILVFSYFILSYTDPKEFQILNISLDTVPEKMWYILGGIFSFLWGFRHLQLSGERKLAMSRADFQETQRRISELRSDVEKVKEPVKKSLPPELPLWYLLARSEMDKDTKELPGSEDNPEILKYHKATTLQAKSDEVAWCSAFVNWCVKTAGFEPTNKANARSWLEWGKELKEPTEGCIVVFKRGNEPWMGHVGFYARTDGNQVMCLGGNQGNEVNISGYHKDRVLGYRTI